MAATPVTPAGLARVGLHVLLAALPLLAISAHVFGLFRMNSSAALLVIPLATAIVALTLFAPHPEERVILHGFAWGVIACALYDVFRLDTVYMLGWWGDFIPTMGTWIVGDASQRTAGAWVGYLWRYLGDGGGIGVTFFVGAAFLGLHHRPARHVVAASVAFAVFPVWTGLIATVWLAPRGQSMMFPLTPVTLTLSLIGHLIFGLIMGLGFVRSQAAHRYWPWTPVVGRFAAPAPSALAPSALAPSALAPSALAPSDRAPVPEAPAEPTIRVEGTPSGRMRPPPARPGTAERPVVVPPPPLPAGHPSAPFPRQHPSGPLPVAGSTGAQPVAARTGSQPVVGPRTGAHASAGPSTGSTRTATTGSHRTATRTESSARPATPVEGTTLDPETWALWQRQLATTVKGRRTHRWR